MQVGDREENGMEKVQEGESYINCSKIAFAHLNSEELRGCFLHHCIHTQISKNLKSAS